MLPVVGSKWLGGYGFRPFQLETTGISFHNSRRAAGKNVDGCRGTNISAVWTPRLEETLINGVLQGRKQNDRKGASALSRVQIWNFLLETINLFDIRTLRNILELPTYQEMKVSQGLRDRRHVKKDVKKEALKGWNQ